MNINEWLTDSRQFSSKPLNENVPLKTYGWFTLKVPIAMKSYADFDNNSL